MKVKLDPEQKGTMNNGGLLICKDNRDIVLCRSVEAIIIFKIKGEKKLLR